MAATYAIVLDTIRQKANGKYPVKLRVTFNRFPRLFRLGIDMTKDEFDVYHSSKKLRHFFDEICHYQNKAKGVIEELKDGFTWEGFEIGFLSKKEIVIPKSTDVFESMQNYKNELVLQEQIKTSISYQCSYNSLSEFVGIQGGLSLNEIKKLQKNKALFSKISFLDVTTIFLKNYEKYMRSKQLSTSTIGIYMRNIRTIYNRAIESGLVPQEAYPFGKNKYSPPTSAKRKKALSIEEIGKIFTYKANVPKEKWAKDMWIFAYLSNGLNIKDVAYLKYGDIVGDEIQIIRQKTKNSQREMEKKIIILITPEMKEIIKRWGNKNKTQSANIFNILRKSGTPLELLRDVEQAIKSINLYVTRIGEHLNLSIRPTSGIVRHSYATILKRAGVSTEMISEQLGHSNIKTTEVYLNSFEKDQRKETVKYLTAFKKETT